MKNQILEGPVTAQQADAPAQLVSITRDELKRKVDRGDDFTLVETLAPEQFQEGHLPGAINMPPDQVSKLAPGLLPDKQVEVITYCASRTCHASGDAARALMKLGYTNVRHYVGGKADWTFAGLPIERSN
jgi:rhodanese-related sulfurtransferase